MERWLPTEMRGPVARVSCDYVQTSLEGRRRCDLCETGWMDETACYRHFYGTRHARQYDQLLVAQCRAMQKKSAAALRDSRHGLVAGIEQNFGYLGGSHRTMMRKRLYRFVTSTRAATHADIILRPFAALVQDEIRCLLCLAATRSLVLAGQPGASMAELRCDETQRTAHRIHVASVTGGHTIATHVMSFLIVAVSGSITCCVTDQAASAHSQVLLASPTLTTVDPMCSHAFFLDSVLNAYPLSAQATTSCNVFVHIM